MTKFPKLTIFTDGGARGNPGPAALGVVIYDEKGKIIKKFGRFLGEKTNNEAEYEAVIEALVQAADLGAQQVKINLDSELVARQLNGLYRVKNSRMQAYVLKIRNLEAQFEKAKPRTDRGTRSGTGVSYKTIPREKNALADRLVNAAIDNRK